LDDRRRPDRWRRKARQEAKQKKRAIPAVDEHAVEEIVDSLC
jgi:hypothetical protein